MDETRETTPAPAPQTPPVKTEETPQLTVQDLQNVLVIVDTACQRGAFKAPEMKGIGELYDKISSYIKKD